MSTIYGHPSETSRVGVDISSSDSQRRSSSIHRIQESKTVPVLSISVLEKEARKEILPESASSGRSDSSREPSVRLNYYGVICALGSNGILLALNICKDAYPLFQWIPQIHSTCDASPSESQRHPPRLVSQLYRSESMFVANIILISLYWSFVVSLFNQGRWRKKYYPRVFLTLVSGTILTSFYVRDIAALLVFGMPTILSICMIGCSLADIF
ncbi:hypothetical protein F4677DRAFT_52535 [Hypoxylon crocopeplum]|nr:hypothetical protein F4677DRAFT_52535 [Hypoxylon crocopeplum]